MAILTDTPAPSRTTTAPAPPPAQVLSFTEPLPGFPGHSHYVLVAEATANLRAPVVVAPSTGRARQVVQSDGAHPLRRRLRR